MSHVPNTTEEAIEFLKKEGYEVFIDAENEMSKNIIVTSGGSIKAVGFYDHTTVKTVDTFGIEREKVLTLRSKAHSNQIHKFLIEVVKDYLPAPNADLEKLRPSFSIMDFLNDPATHTPKLANLNKWEQDYLAVKLLKYIKKHDKKDEPITDFAKSIDDFLTTINIITANSFYLVLFDNINSWGNHFHSKLHSTLERRANTWKKLDLINTSKQGKIVFNSYIRNVVNARFNELFNSTEED
ncbi:MAG: hypothetical protein LBC87_01940 [Fibromonadaceae bacterium]|jgi:hypothetical protein|nr:hypothetical protein [Fibromonadaceae bacterium]